MAEPKRGPYFSEKQGHHDHTETHGLRDDIDVNSSMSDVKAPNVFERAKEEIEAIVGALHSRKGSKDSADSQSCGEASEYATKDPLKNKKSELHSEKNELHGHKPNHHKETHGSSDDIDANTPISDVKGPNVFERAKEEIEALIHTIHPKKDPGNGVSDTNTQRKFPMSIGKGLEKIWSPRGHNKD